MLSAKQSSAMADTNGRNVSGSCRFVGTAAIFSSVPGHLYSEDVLSSPGPLHAVIVAFIVLGGITHMLLTLAIHLKFKHHIWTAGVCCIFVITIPSVQCDPLTGSQMGQHLETFVNNVSFYVDSLMQTMFTVFGSTYSPTVIENHCFHLQFFFHVGILFFLISYCMWIVEWYARAHFCARQFVGNEQPHSDYVSNLAPVIHAVNMVVGSAVLWHTGMWVDRAGPMLML